VHTYSLHINAFLFLFSLLPLVSSSFSCREHLLPIVEKAALKKVKKKKKKKLLQK
jgi:hypothetical protein